MSHHIHLYLKNVELYYLIRELTYYDENIVLLIKYFYEFELEFINDFKKYIYQRLIYNYKYSFVFNYNTYRMVELFIHPLNKKNKQNIIHFHINIHYNIQDSTEQDELKIFRYYLTFYDIVKAVTLSHKKYRTKTQKINFETIEYTQILDILLAQNGIYKKI